jgi:multidrug efflux pump subunit AcrA (membrane-fusion protein)
MNWKYVVLPLLAVGGIVAAAVTVNKQSRPAPVPPPLVPPAGSPFAGRVSGSGIVEPSSELILLGAPVSGLVEEVPVVEGQRVKRGEALFVIDRRTLRSQLIGAEARLMAAEARFLQAKSLPKPETLAQAEARAEQARTVVNDAQGRLDRLLAVGEAGALSRNEKPTREFELASAKARLAEAEANLAFVRRGTYPEDLKVVESEVAIARAEAESLRTELDRCIARAPIDCTVLRIEARPGEYAAAGPGAEVQMQIPAHPRRHRRARRVAVRPQGQGHRRAARRPAAVVPAALRPPPADHAAQARAHGRERRAHRHARDAADLRVRGPERAGFDRAAPRRLHRGCGRAPGARDRRGCGDRPGRRVRVRCPGHR